MRYLGIACILMSVVTMISCATIVGDPDQVIPISSSPEGAEVNITDENGFTVFKGETPTSAKLQKSNGRYFGSKRYRVTLTKAGYQTQTVSIAAKPNGWYIGGNLIFGGLIGYLIVDPLTGSMYTLSPEAVKNSKSISKGLSTYTHNNKNTDGSIAIVMLEDVPEFVRPELVPVTEP